MKKGQTWISAAIYLGIGIVAMTLILSAALPLIRNLRDENTVSQTTDLLTNLDNVIRNVAIEGAGSKRIFSVDIRKGDFKIIAVDLDNDGIIDSRIVWSLDTDAEVAELDQEILIGDVKLKQVAGGGSKNTVSLTLDYLDSSIIFTEASNKASLVGANNLIIENKGSRLVGTDFKVEVEILVQ